jgi:hypothetical protein
VHPSFCLGERNRQHGSTGSVSDLKRQIVADLRWQIAPKLPKFPDQPQSLCASGIEVSKVLTEKVRKPTIAVLVVKGVARNNGLQFVRLAKAAKESLRPLRAITVRKQGIAVCWVPDTRDRAVFP